VEEAILRKARAYALLLLRYRPRTEKEFRDKLTRKGFSETIICRVMEEFRKKGALDDLRFARLLCDHRLTVKKIGPAKIAHELREKGVDKTIIQEALSEADVGGQTQYESAKACAVKKADVLRKKDMSAYVLRGKVANYLARKGYDYELIARVVREL
jgi:regulatory protein